MNLNPSTSKGEYHQEAHVMPNPPMTPWKWDSQWDSTNPYEGIMEFTSDRNMTNSYQKPIKRKLKDSGPLPAKQCITEERMTAHFNGLHISSDEADIDNSDETQIDNSKGSKICLPMTQRELEEKLKNGNRVKICEELSKLKNYSNFLIPNIHNERIARPCTALILWQPQRHLGDLIAPTNKSNDSDSDEEDNNNSSSLDFNSNNNNNNLNVNINDAMDTDTDM